MNNQLEKKLEGQNRRLRRENQILIKKIKDLEHKLKVSEQSKISLNKEYMDSLK